ncbi:MAG: hypothetical protein Q9212_002832, partial [Teloschistes hypoglaucus]
MTNSQLAQDPDEQSTLSREASPVLREAGSDAPSSSGSAGKDSMPTKWMKYTLRLVLPKRSTVSSSYNKSSTASQSQEPIVAQTKERKHRRGGKKHHKSNDKVLKSSYHPAQSETSGPHGSTDSYPTSSTLETSLIDRGEVQETSSKRLYEIKESAGKGLGTFATQEIKRGTRIMCEKPLLDLRDGFIMEIWAAFSALPLSAQSLYRNLSYQNADMNWVLRALALGVKVPYRQAAKISARMGKLK